MLLNDNVLLCDMTEQERTRGWGYLQRDYY